MWLKILGGALFTIGAIMVLIPGIDELLFLTPLFLYFGAIVIPIYYAVGFGCLIIGMMITGVHLLPFLKSHPIIPIMMFIVLMIIIWIAGVNTGVISV